MPKSRVLDALLQSPKLMLWGRVRTDAFQLSFGQLAFLMTAIAIVSTAAVWARSADYAEFNMYGINSAFAAWGAMALLLSLALVGLRGAIAPVIAAVAALSGWLWLIAVAGQSALSSLLAKGMTAIMAHPWAAMVFYAAYVAVFYGIYARFGYRTVRQLVPAASRKRAAVAAAALCLAPFAYPYQPLLSNGDSEMGATVNVWELASDYIRMRRAPRVAETPTEKPLDVEAIFDRQHALVDAAVDALATEAGSGRYYFVGFAGYSGQNVFKSEIEKVRAIADQHLNTLGRSLNLINHRATTDTTALASVTNLDRTLRLLGQRIDGKRDVLVLYMTSHGADGLFSVNFPRFALNDVTPSALRSILDASGIQNRVIIISACHSGSFIPELKDDHTLIMTAASAERSSFGCSNEREWTYFGDAMFNHAMRQTRDPIAAFGIARNLISRWESEQGLLSSEPQIWVGPQIEARLTELATRIADLPDTGAGDPR